MLCSRPTSFACAYRPRWTRGFSRHFSKAPTTGVKLKAVSAASPIRDLDQDLIEREVAIASGDEDLRTFARQQPVGCWLYDFRRAKVGDGVDLKKLDLVSAHPKLPILALARGRSPIARWLLGRRDLKPLDRHTPKK